mgnify:CR=1 FL=1
MAITKVSAALVDLDGGVVINESSADADFRVESNGNADMLFVDGGNDNVLLGTQNQGHIRLNQQLGLAVTGNVYGGISMATHSSSASGNRSLLDFNRSRNTTIGSHTVVQSGDSLGTIVGRGDDGDEFLDAASIDFEVDATPGNGDMPGRIIFSTTADGANSVSERMRIDSSGNVGIGDSSPDARLKVNSTGGGSELAFKVADASDNSVFEVQGGGTSVFQYGKVGIGITSPDQMLHVSKGSAGSVDSHSSAVITIEDNDHATLQFLTPNDKQQNIFFGDVQDNAHGIIRYDYSTNSCST